MSIRIALAGNPNSGKTTMFNELTGTYQYVGNWPGVTVEKKEGKYKKDKKINIIDLPGIYSLSPYTLEEVVSRNFLIQDSPDAIINIVDSTNIERNLYLTLQILEMGIPTVVALNMTDLLRKSGDSIDVESLSKKLGCPVVETSALKGDGIEKLISVATNIIEEKNVPTNIVKYDKKIENSLEKVEKIIEDKFTGGIRRWYAVKLFENDIEAARMINITDKDLDDISILRTNLEAELEDDIESIITFQRYEYISKIVNDTVKKVNIKRDNFSDNIDKIVTNRILGLPIFALVMYIVYYVSISTIGTGATDWVNDVLFGEIVPGYLDTLLTKLNVSEVVYSLVQDGIVAGVGAILGFLPQMMVLFFMLAILEDTGYMARVAFIMDRIFRRFGLSGKSFIPMLIGTGCSVPGIMASRTIENERDRRITIMTTSFIPCSAKLPIIALIAGALFPDSSIVGPSAYFIGIATVIISGIILKKTNGFAGDPAPFIMELPSYHFPSIKGLLINMWDKAKSFVIKAGTIIFVCSVVIWFLQTFNFKFEIVDASDSILAYLGSAIAPIFTPLGFGDWKAAVATITGLVAKENVVSTFGILYGFEEVAEDGVEIWSNITESFTQLSAYSFLIFNLICAPCFAAIGAINREMQEGKWTLIAILFQTILAYVLAFITYQIGLLFFGGTINIFTIIAFILVAIMLYLLFKPEKRIKRY